MDHNGGHTLVLDLQRGRLPILDADVGRRGVQLVAIGRLQLCHLVPAALRLRDIDDAVAVSGVVAEDLTIHLADLELHARNASAGILVRLDDLESSDFGVIERQCLGILRIHFNRLRPSGGIDEIAVDRLRLCDDDRAGDPGNPDLTVLVSGIEAFAGHMAVVIVHVAAIAVSQLELHAGQGFLRLGIQLPNDQGTLLGVVEGQGLDGALADFNRFGGGVQDVAIRYLDFLCGNGDTRLQALNDDLAGLISDKLTVTLADRRTAGVGDTESDALQGLSRALDILLDDQGRAGRVIECQRLGIIGIYYNGLCLRARIDAVAGDRLRLRDNESADHAVDLDLSIFVGDVQAVAGDVAILIRHVLTGRSGHLERDAGQRLTSQGIPLIDDEAACLGVADDYCLGITALADDHIGRGLVNHIALRRLDLSQYIGAGRQVGDVDLARRIGREDAVLG